MQERCSGCGREFEPGETVQLGFHGDQWCERCTTATATATTQDEAERDNRAR